MPIRLGSVQPNEISGLLHDWDIHNTVYTNGNLVNVWTDVVSGAEFVQNTNAAKMTFVADKMNGYASLVCTDISRSMDNTNNFQDCLSGDFTLFILLYNPTDWASANSIAGVLSGGFDFIVGGSNILRYREYVAGTAVFNINNANLVIPSNKYSICVINMKRGGNCYARTSLINRQLITSSAPATYTKATTGLTRISAVAKDKEYPRILQYNRALTEAEENAVYRGLKLKYRI